MKYREFNLRTRRLHVFELVCLFAAVLPVHADWPTYKGNIERNGTTSDTVAMPLYHAWTHTSTHAPSPAWGQPAVSNAATSQMFADAMGYDRAFHPVVANGRLYYGSSTDDTLYCLDAATGAEQWSFTTDGPIRVVPAVDGNRVFMGSDDGYLYCLDAGNGKEVWRFTPTANGDDATGTCIGNGRLISIRPVRCGVVADRGCVYFACGIFPSRGAYLYSLDAETGAVNWETRLRSAAQGHLTATSNTLFVATGRNTPVVAFDRGRGRGLKAYGKTRSWKKQIHGGTSSLVAGETFIAGPSEGGQLHAFPVRGSGDLRLLATGTAVASDGGTASVISTDPAFTRYRLEKIDLDDPKSAPVFSRQCAPAFCVINSGTTIFTGGENGVAAFNNVGEKVWDGIADGNVLSLAVSDGRLYASTDMGAIHCYSTVGMGQPDKVDGALSPPPPDSQSTREAETVLSSLDSRKGFCLITRPGSAELAYAIAARSELRVVGIEQEPAEVERSRNMLKKAGIYGSRVTVHHADSTRLELPRYFANLVVSGPPYTKDDMMPFLRPYGGVLSHPSGLTVRGPLAGAGEWTHLYAEPGNTACSGDTTLSGPMDILWFGGPGPERQIDRHYRNVPPLFKNGILFVPGDEILQGVDAYNGTVLWRREIPHSRRTGAFLDAGSMAVDDRYFYAASANTCLGLDPLTGKQLTTFYMPRKLRDDSDWGGVMPVGDTLIGSICREGASHSIVSRSVGKLLWYLNMPIVTSTSILASDISSAQIKWHYEEGVVLNTTLCSDMTNLYFVESESPFVMTNTVGKHTSRTIFEGGKQYLTALSIESGSVNYRREIDGSAFSEPVYMNCANGILLFSGSRPENKALRYTYFAFNAEDGVALWSQSHVTYEGDAAGGHGEQNRHPTIIGNTVYAWPYAYNLQTGEKVEGWKMDRSGHGCGGVSASANSIFWRGHNPWMRSIDPGSRPVRLTDVTRPGCWINTIPAGGLVLIPEASAGCACAYSVQTSIGLVPRL